MTDAPPVLRISELAVHYGSARQPAPVLDEVTFDVPEGQTVGLVGESGSGKTQTMLAVIGLLGRGGRVVRGSIEFAGRELVRLPDRELRALRGRDLGMVFQDPMTSLDPVIRIGDQIGEAIRAHDWSLGRAALRSRAAELLSLVGIPDAETAVDRYPHQLSGGMRQRVGLAIALANQPRLLIADEPTTALDVTIQAQVLELMTELRRRSGAALVLITHDLSLLAEHADRVVVLYAGMVVETGTVEEIFRAPRHPYTVGLITSRPTLDIPPKTTAPLPTIPGTPAAASGGPTGCPFLSRCELARGRSECATIRPALVSSEDGRAVRCHWPDEAAELLIMKAGRSR